MTKNAIAEQDTSEDDSAATHCYAVGELVWFSYKHGDCELIPAVVTKRNRKSVKVNIVVINNRAWVWGRHVISAQPGQIRKRLERFPIDDAPPI